MHTTSSLLAELDALPDPPGFAAGIAELGLRARMARDLRQVLAVIADRLGC